MAYDNNQKEFPLPGENPEKRESSRHLPKYFRTEKNQKFLNSTLDQILQPGVAEKVNAFVGRKTAKAFDINDNYIADISSERQDYQFEPVSIIRDRIGNIEYYKDYRDFINQIENFNGVNNNHSRNTEQEYYAWDPHIDWDKFSNFREYYWLPNGPQTVVVPGDAKEITSTYTVSLENALGNFSYIFTPDGLTSNPSLKLYRGVKYIFEINTPGYPLTFRTARTLEDQFLLKDEVSDQVVENGIIEIELGPETPNEIFYVADNDINLGGIIKVANQSEATTIDVEQEIIGKKQYTTRDGWSFTNGLKVRFEGDVKPSKYSNSEWYVEGVGQEITLVSDIDVEVSFPVGIDLTVPFDSEGFDRNPFGEATGYPRDKDYITINRSSNDGNFWSRYNRWFHIDVINLVEQINNTPNSIDQDQRANRPIIEFEPGLKLYNFGTRTKEVIDLIDDYTTDAFSTIEGSLGYNIDGVQLTEGMRVLFLNDTDPLVRGKIFEVNFINFAGSGVDGQIRLVETADTDPIAGENVLVTQGTAYSGKIWYYDGTNWNIAQEKTSVNQPPVFDLFDENNVSFSNTDVYPATTFRGTRLFGYKQGAGTNDVVLGFPLSYRSIENVGDIVFDFYYNSDSFQYQLDEQIFYKDAKEGYLRKYNTRNQFEVLGAYTKAISFTSQNIILQYINDGTRNSYPINCFNQSAFIDDLQITVEVNNQLKYEGTDYELFDSADKLKNCRFLIEVPENASIIFTCKSSAPKNQNGYYEIASNLEKNPLNQDVTSFTLGEVSDHVSTIVRNLETFSGIFPGPSNLRDIANQSKYGQRFVKHSSPLNLSMYSILDKDSNLIKSLRYAKKEYSKFKRLFLQTAESLGFDGPAKQHVDAIITEIVKDKTNTMPFYFSDMISFGPAITTTITVEDIDSQFFALTTPFTLNDLSTRAVTVYLNDNQLIHGLDYTFNSEGFLQITASKEFGDVIQINEYETTNGSFIPPTPSKLGLYPSWRPEIFEDDTYGIRPKMIRGHDGSLVKAFDDYRDDLILELEKRIFNNIKIAYDSSIHDIHSYLPGLHRDTSFTREEIYRPMTTDFIQWLSLVDQDYTENTYFDRLNTFTFNYSSLRDKNGNFLPGWWRGIYQYYFDTDRPHTHPWEMLGFTIQPAWWEEVYGPAPYTKDNLLLWEDLEAGIVREPNTGFTMHSKYARPGLTSFIPVDGSGNLLGPSDCNIPLRFASANIDADFEFGDNAPVESAWFNSSEYPFALLTSWAINSPARLLATGFDRSRQVKDILGHIVYSTTNRQIKLSDLVFPNTAQDTQEILTSGLVNYIAGFMASNSDDSFKLYENNLKSIKNSMAFKLGGFTDKSKFKLILDSRTPLNNGNVFVPEENYQIFLNTSSPLKTISYSGVIVELSSSGYIIRGYDKDTPSFKYYEPLSSTDDIAVNVGGVSETFSNWAENRTYVKGSIVKFGDKYYRVTSTFTSTDEFDLQSLRNLPSLPTVGGVDAIFKRKFDRVSERIVPYGTTLKTVQDVVDFLLGYEAWLKDQGFQFEYYDGEEKVISDWKNASRELMFWTTQKWSEGALISLSPAADELYVQLEYSTVDNVYDSFYGYGLVKSDGRKLREEYLKITRQEKNVFRIQPSLTADGIYACKLPIVQKEHIVILDNTSVFGDVIYQPATGYRQERIKVLGYKTTDWNGTLDIPGFLYSEVKIKEWDKWVDYSIGDIVAYKEFFYIAKDKIPGSEVFNYNNWERLYDVPESGLITNFEYKTNQFADFYDLDTDNFDVDQQQLAQHLIGYQKRTYLQNIINDEVSQYKFYQGMIQDKGTRNSLDKLFDVLSAADRESLDFYEEWAIKQGQYGASEGFEEVEFRLDEKNMRLSPQPFKLTNSDTLETNLIYRIKDFEVFRKPKNYTSNAFPELIDYEQFTRSSGYVNTGDVSYSLDSYDDILQLDINNLNESDYIWVGKKDLDWDVLNYEIADSNVVKIETLGSPIFETTAKNQVEITLNNSPIDINEGDIIGLRNIIITDRTPDDSTDYPISKQTQSTVQGFFKVVGKQLNKIYVDTNEDIERIPECFGLVTKFVSARARDYDHASIIAQQGLENNSLIWVDNQNENWKVLYSKKPYSLLQEIPAEEAGESNNFGGTIAIDGRNTVLAVGSSSVNDGKLFVYTRGGSNQNYQFAQIIVPTRESADFGKSFGKGIGISRDGTYMLVGAPDASNVKSKFRGDFNPTTDYQNGEIVKYAEQLWEVVVDIQGADAAAPFGSFGSIIEVFDKYNLLNGEDTFNNIITGNYPFENVQTDHILVRAPVDQYRATAPGDTVFLDWYLQTTANQNQDVLVDRQPFNGEIAEINETLLESGLEIQKKVDVVLYINSVTTLPQIGDQIEAGNVFGYVNYIYTDEGEVTLYVERTSGNWANAASLFLETGEFVGEYIKVAPIENTDTSEDLGGYWYFDVGQTYDVVETTQDEGRALAVTNIIPAGQQDSGATGSNIYDLNNEVTDIGENSVNSYLRTLTYQGTPGPNGSFAVQKSDLFVVRAPRDLSNITEDGDEIGLSFVRFPRFSDDFYVDITVAGITYEQINKKHTLVDKWSGYIDFQLDNTDSNTNIPFVPKIGQFVRDTQTNATAKVQYLQKFNNSRARIYVDNVVGNWSIGGVNGQDIEMVGIPDDPDPNYQTVQLLGQIDATALGSDELNIGDLFVFRLDAEIEEVPEQDTVIGAEYVIYKDTTIFGLPTQPNIPASNNFDYKQVFSIPVDPFGESSDLSNYGYFSVYFRENVSTYTFVNSFIVPEEIAGLRIGSQIKVAKRNNLYKAFIGCQGDGTTNNPGRIYFVNNGTDDEGISYNWELAKDKRYKGVFDQNRDYFIDDIVYYEGYFYKALTNIAGDGSSFIALEWQLATNDQIRSIDYLGYVPNDTGNYTEDYDYKGIFSADSTYVVGEIVQYINTFYRALRNIPLNYNGFTDNNGFVEYPVEDWEVIDFTPGGDTTLGIDSTNLVKFGEYFDVSDNAEVLIATADYADSAVLTPILNAGALANVEITFAGRNYETPPKVTVLRKGTTWDPEDDDINAEVSVTIDADGSIDSVTINNPGNDYDEIILVVEPAQIKRKVIVYRNVNDNYQKSQEIITPLLNDANIDFARSISISQDGKLIAIGAPGADDSSLGEDVGAVFVYEQINGTFTLSQTLRSAKPIQGEDYGKLVQFDGNNLHVSAFNASSDDVTIFDNGSTVFDNEFTYFKNEIAINGVVYAYDRVDNTMIYGQQIDYHTYVDRDNIAEADLFGRSMLASGSHLYVTMPQYRNQNDRKGLVLDYRRESNNNLWEITREYTAPADLAKIKQIKLYSLSKNEILENLDYIDPVQGKIAGPADEEIRLKTAVDPAFYTNGTSAVNVDDTNSWGKPQVGTVWWDTTNAKFLNVYQGNIIYKTNNFNTLAPGASIDVYEWVESKIPPLEWDNLTGSVRGESQGISGTTKYGQNVFSLRRVYDNISQKFTNYYYFWVKNKTTIPDIDSRSISIDTVAKLIEDPSGQGYKFISIFDSSNFALHNCNDLVEEKDTILNIQYWTSSDDNSNIHNQYQILTEGLGSSVPYPDIVRKFIDSLVGFDEQTRPVPDPSLSVKDRYGILNTPRQSMFVNKTEALKQIVERVNSVLSQNLIVDEKDISKLLENDPAPSATSGIFDIAIDTKIDLDFVDAVRARTAQLQPVIEDGKIIRVDIVDSGRGYLIEPTYTILGQGSNAELEFTIDNLGQITNVDILDAGINYNEFTTIQIRPFTVLVSADESINGKWAIYERANNDWLRVGSQTYDVSLYWDYTDWYEGGYDQFTGIDKVIDLSYSLQGLDDNIGDIVKILNVGGEGWLLLEKIDNQDTTDYTINYKTIGKQNGTIQIKDSSYNFASNSVGFDNQTFDTQFFDLQPVAEIRLILTALQEDIFVNDLETEFNNLFFVGLRYAFSEQGYIDWAFKTSFVKAQHNVGELEQKVTFKNDSLESYEDYIKEVKPYKTKIREYLSNYTKLDAARNVITDFDSPPRYNAENGRITATDVRVVDNVLFGTGFSTAIDQQWLDNLTYKVIEIEIADPGSGYLSAPEITIEGNATAKVSLGPSGIISNVTVIDGGSGYLSVPSITVNGSQRDGGTPAKLSAVIGDSPVRSMHTVLKFDRVSGAFFITQLNESETFTGNGSKTEFGLKWPMDMRTDTIEILVNGQLVLNSEYDYDNFINTEFNYDKYYGRISFIDPPANNSTIEVNYKKSINLLDSQDRINLFYNPTDGQIGKDVSQLMDGVDYGGIEVKSFDFGGSAGWDSDSWYTGAWDLYDDTFEDETFTTDGSTLVFNLAKPLEAGVKYNVYINGTRVDDDAWDGTSTVDNQYAIMSPVVGDGITDTFTFENENGYRLVAQQLDNSGLDNPPPLTITIRKSTSDGSIKINEESFDTSLNGGDLAYTTATGINAEDIVVDGDGFVTVTTSKGPEETVPGQIMDTLDITVYERPNSGSSRIENSLYTGDGSTKIFDLVQKPFAFENVIVKVDYQIFNSPSDYKIDYQNDQIEFYSAPSEGASIAITSTGLGGANILDYGELLTDGTTQEFETTVKFTETANAYVTVNGEVLPFEITQDSNGYCLIRFVSIPPANRTVQFGIFDNEIDSFSQVSIEEIIADGSSASYSLGKTPFEQQPTSYYTIVTVNNDRVLNAGYSELFTIEDGVLEYPMKKWQIPVGSIAGIEIKVFLNGRELEFLQQWTYEGAVQFNPNINPDAQEGSTIILNRGVANAGDELKVFVLSSGEYRFGYFDSSNEFVDTSGKQLPATLTPTVTDGVITAVEITDPGRGYSAESNVIASGQGNDAEITIDVDEIGRIVDVNIVNGGNGYNSDLVLNIEIISLPTIIYFDEVFNDGDVIRVYQFSNHNGLGIEREKYDVVERTQMTLGTQGYYDFRQLKNNLIELRKTALSVDYVWISVNGKWLTPTADYILLENKKVIQFITPLEDYNEVDIIHFANSPISNRLGWRQFKDMLNKTTYLRLSSDNEYKLAQTLNWYDRAIEVAGDASNLPEPDAGSRYPGVLFINGERIEYFRKEGNILKQLRRGTLGTGIKNSYEAGTIFYNQSVDSIMPYTDEEERFTTTSGSYTDMSTLYPEDSIDIKFESISYDFNNNTVFPVRVPGVYEQIATVTGSGFRPDVQVIMQDTDGNPRELEKVSSTETEIKFHTETMPVGAYDLVIVNPREEAPAIRQQGSLVISKILPYVQILLPYEPEAFTDVVRNPVETGEWYKEPFEDLGIPEEYWQALNIEVFANGRRLRKNPIKIYDVTKGQFSPDGDIDIQAEYAVNQNEGGYVRLTTPPEPNTTLTIVRKLGEDWREIESTSPLVFKPLSNSNTKVATFLRGKSINLPR